MGTMRAYRRAQEIVKASAKQAHFSEEQVSKLVNIDELEQCVRVISTIEANPEAVGAKKRAAMRISKGGKTIIDNSAYRVQAWIRRHKKRDVDNMVSKLKADVRTRCKKLLGDPLKDRAKGFGDDKEASN